MRKALYYIVLFFLCATPLLGQASHSSSENPMATQNPDSLKTPRSVETAEPVRILESAARTAVIQQDPLYYYVRARESKRMQELSDKIKMIDLHTMGLGHDWLLEEDKAIPTDSVFTIHKLFYVTRFHRRGFLEKFREVYWVGGVNYGRNEIDTLNTQVLRGKMQHAFGSPSSTIFDVPPERRRDISENVQFEYYFMVNDTIPVMVMDVEGPHSKGLVFAVDLHHQSQYYRIRQEISQRIADTKGIEPFNDYYFDKRNGRWYEVGFDGEDYFRLEIPQPRATWERPQLRIRNKVP